MQLDMEKIWLAIQDFAAKYAGKVIYCLIAYLILLIVRKSLIKVIKVAMEKTDTNLPLFRFLISLVKIGFYIVLGIIILSAFDVPITAFVTLFSAVGLAFSLAIKDTLANFAEGIIMLFTKPFKIGDYIEASGLEGKVEKIELVYTRLLTPDNKAVLIPNGDLASDKITNYSAEPTRRLDRVFFIDYHDDVDKAKRVLLELLDKHPLVLKEPKPFVRVKAHSSSSIDLEIRVWVKTEKYWDLNFDLYEQVKDAFDQNGISIPYPQMDIHILERKTE